MTGEVNVRITITVSSKRNNIAKSWVTRRRRSKIGHILPKKVSMVHTFDLCRWEMLD